MRILINLGSILPGEMSDPGALPETGSKSGPAETK